MAKAPEFLTEVGETAPGPIAEAASEWKTRGMRELLDSTIATRTERMPEAPADLAWVSAITRIPSTKLNSCTYTSLLQGTDEGDEVIQVGPRN